jgi:hypothetical protein
MPILAIDTICRLPLASSTWTFYDRVTKEEERYESDSTRSIQNQATAAHRRGVVIEKRCKHCRDEKRAKKFFDCVVVEGYLGGRGTNCAWQDSSSRSCIRETSPAADTINMPSSKGKETALNRSSNLSSGPTLEDDKKEVEARLLELLGKQGPVKVCNHLILTVCRHCQKEMG